MRSQPAIFSVIALLVAAFPLSVHSSPASRLVYTKGYEINVRETFEPGTPISSARTRLMDNATRRAVRAALADLPFFDRLETDKAVATDSKLDRYVSGKSIKAEDLQQDRKSMTIRVELRLDRLVGAYAMAGLAHLLRPISVDAQVSETIGLLDVPDPSAQSSITNCLLRAGFRVRRSSRKSPTTFTAYGQAYAEVTSGVVDQQVFSARARIEVPVLASDGKIIAVVVEQASAADIARGMAGKRALESAGALAGERICGALLLASQAKKEEKP